MNVPGRIMALDVGDARIGIALSDPLRIIAQPHSTLERNKKAVPALVELIKREAVKIVVIGLPKTLDGELKEQAQKTIAFKEKLVEGLRNQKLTDVGFELWDERLTTVNAERIIKGTKLKDKNRRALLDQVSATLILESYMNSLSDNG